MTKIAIVGSGLIGRAWATVFANHGFEVALHDVRHEAALAARSHIAVNLVELEGHGLVADPDAALARIRVAEDLADAVSNADLVQENGPETVEAKLVLFAEMDRLALPDAILASSTSFILASAFSDALPGRARCLVAHPVNPPHLVPIVELAPAPWTAPEIVARAKVIYEAAGQVPIVLRKEKPGFILNRLQAVLLAEAFRLVGDGVVSPQDLDKTICDGLGLRWSFLGPFATIELNAPGGIPDYCARYTGFYKRLADEAPNASVYGADTVERIASAWGSAPDPARHAELSARRDRRLAALAAHKRQQSSEEKT